MKKRQKNSRRQFIKDFSDTIIKYNLFETVFSSILASQTQKLWATEAANSQAIKNFLHINFAGAPPSWFFDLFLKPLSNSAFMNNSMVKNVYVVGSGNDNGGRYVDGAYRTVQHSGYNVPYLFSLNVPAPDNKTRRASDLLGHLMSFRGIDVGIPVHEAANALHQSGRFGEPTIHSPTADRANLASNKNILRSLILNGSSRSIFKSRLSYSATSYNVKRGEVNELSNLFSSLLPVKTNNSYSNIVVTNSRKVLEKIESALEALNGSSSYDLALRGNAGNSLNLLYDNTITIFDNLPIVWETLFNKYKDLIDRTFKTTYVGINDKPIGKLNAKTNELRSYLKDTNQIFANVAGNNIDLRSLFVTDRSQSDTLAARFAVIEFLMVNNLCPSISVVVPSPIRLSAKFVECKFDNSNTFDFSKNVEINNDYSTGLDQHLVGYMPGILINSMFYLSFTACLLELIAQLDTKKMFDETLIYMAGEFNRSPRDQFYDEKIKSYLPDGSGSDHSTSANVSLISGKINGLKVYGNILRDASGTGGDSDLKYRGTWGRFAPAPSTGNNSPLKIFDFWASIMKLLGYPMDQVKGLDPSRLIFNTPGDFTVKAPFNGLPENVDNKS
ncbi:MAG: DUF1501 domain-containing protein [Bdellovibrionales bacterium]|nr:DUF1501 domain-containing protein [Bdellovibrionales bacterium]